MTRKTRRGIWVSAALLILALVVAALVLRQRIIGHALSVTISKKSDQNISLKVDSLDYHLWSSTLMLYNAALQFDSLELNEEHNRRLRELRFGKIEMSGISIFRLLIFREIKAYKLLVSAPSSLLTSNNQSTPAQVNPQEILNGLNKNKNLFGHLVIHIDQIHLAGGHFMLEKMHPHGMSLLEFDYGIQLLQFNTGKALFSDTTRFLFSSQMQVKLDSVQYRNPFGDGIVADSVTFISGSTRLGVFGLLLQPSDSSQNKTAIAGQVKHIELDGVIPDSPEEAFDLQFKAITISGANIRVTSSKPDDHTEKKPGNSLLKVIRSLELNRVNVSNSHLWIANEGNDTLFNARINQLAVVNFLADSGFQLDREKISFQNLLWDARELAYMDPLQGLRVELTSTSFNEKTGHLLLHNTRVSDLDSLGERSFDLTISQAEMAGVNFSAWLHHAPVELKINLINPQLILNQPSGENRTSKKPFRLPSNLTIVSVDISNGLFNYQKQDAINLETDSINLHTGNIYLRDFGKLHTLSTDSLTLSTGRLQLGLLKKATKIHWEQLVLNKKQAKLSNLQLNVEGFDNITMQGLVVESPDLHALANGEPLATGMITLFSPTYIGTIDSRKTSRPGLKPDREPEALQTLLIAQGITINQGWIDARLLLNNDTLNITSGVNLTTGKFSITNHMDKNWLARLRWALSLDQPTLTHRLGKVSATELVYSNNNKLLNISNLAINDHRQTGNPLTVNLFTLDDLTMSEIDYRNFVLTHTLDFGTLLLSHPRVQIEIAKKTTAKNTTQSRHKIIDLNELPFSFREIKLEDMQVELTQLDSVNHSHFNLGEVDLKITGQKPASQHLTDHLTFAIQGFSFADDNRSQQLSIEKINYNPQNGTLSMDQLTGSRKDADTAMTVLSYAILRGEFGRFKVSNSLPSEISFGSIRLNHPQLHHQSREGTHIAHKPDTTPTHIKLPWQLEKFTIDTLILNHLDVYHTEIHPSGEITTHLKDLRVEVNHIGADTAGLNTNDFSFVESTRIQTGNNSFVSSDSLYVTELKSIGYNFSTNTLTLDSLQIVPRYPDAEFFKKAQFQTDQIHLFGERIVGNNFRFTSFLNTGDIHLGSLDIYGLDARLFRNKNYPTNPADYKKMPQEMMLDVNKPFLIDSIRTHDAEIHYKEVVEKAKDPGYIFFDQFNLSLYNLTNIPERLATDSILRANLKARVMGKTNLNLNLFVDITSPTREFWFSGYTESIEFTALNPVTQNLVGVDMQGGEGRVLIPLIKGDSSHTSGRVVFLYKKLKVGLYNREKARSTTGLARGMANILLNDIFIRSNNPTFLRKPKTGVVYSDRVTQKSFVFYVWKSILSGMLSTFGINTRQQRHEKRTMNAPSD